jgi:hypothetical protein
MTIRQALGILGFDKPVSSVDDIKKRYRKLSMTHHPDKGGNATEFVRLNEAYQVLLQAELGAVVRISAQANPKTVQFSWIDFLNNTTSHDVYVEFCQRYGKK